MHLIGSTLIIKIQSDGDDDHDDDENYHCESNLPSHTTAIANDHVFRGDIDDDTIFNGKRE